MKRNFFTSILLLLGLFFYVGLASCKQEAPDFSKKERDPRLIGIWYLIDDGTRSIHPGYNVLEFKLDGSCTGFSYQGGKRLFYTEGNEHLFVFVYGDGFKLNNSIHDRYYLFEGDTLRTWAIKSDMLDRRYEAGLTYTKTPNP